MTIPVSPLELLTLSNRQRLGPSCPKVLDEMTLLSLPHEVLQSILLNVDPLDLASLCGTCHALNTFVDNNVLLFKELYLKCFPGVDQAIFSTPKDEPPTIARPICSKSKAGKLGQIEERPEKKVNAHGKSSSTASLSTRQWKKELTQLLKLEKLLSSESRQVRLDNFTFIFETTLHLLRVTPSAQFADRNVAFLARLYNQKLNQDILLCGSSLFEFAGSKDQTAFDGPEQRQMAAKLHCLYGVPIAGDEEGSVPCQPYACSRVYDLRKYTEKTMWGPFMDDGSQNVDWERMEVIMIDLNHNIQQFRERLDGNFPNIWTKPFEGATGYSFLDQTLQSDAQQSENITCIPRSPVELEDPYNITGTWLRVVCFLDYRELFAFNFIAESPPPGEDRPALDTQEAFRLIVMKLRATSIEPPGPNDGQDLPVVRFEGRAQALSTTWDPNAHSDMRGWVKLTPEGEVQWTTFSVYGGEERWRSEGIQIGGVQAARGVLGNWFDKDYEEQGPAGPTAFWKVSNALEVEKQGTRFTIR